MKEAKFLKDLIDLNYKTVYLPNRRQTTVVSYSDITALIGKYRRILHNRGYQLLLNGDLKKVK